MSRYIDDGVLSPLSHAGDGVAKAMLVVASPTTMSPGLICILILGKEKRIK
jgi:hypothetical protein